MQANQISLPILRADEAPSLKEFYQRDFRIGAAIVPEWLNDANKAAVLRHHFTSITAENVSKPEVLLSRAATIASGSNTRAVFSLVPIRSMMDWAEENGIAVRFHVLVWHNQTPRWFFAEDWSDAPDAPLVSRDVMLERMRHYICDVMREVNASWPGVVYAWDVVNEAIEPDHHAENCMRTKSCWYQIFGEDFIPAAFRIARACQISGQQLYYNDFNVAQPDKTPYVYRLVKKLHDEGLIDGVGMQTHIGLDYPSFADYEQAIRDFAALGLTVQATEMDIRVDDARPKTQMLLAMRYRDYFQMMLRLRREGLPIDSITLWGLTDDRSWLLGWKGTGYPLLFDGTLRTKPAFWGALLDERVPTDVTNMEDTPLPLEAPIKPLSEHNPVITHMFGADPWALVWQNRVYLYLTADAPDYAPNGTVVSNHYGHIHSLRCLSSADLVNWTDHGDIPAAGLTGLAKWARNSWAPCAAHKRINGQDKFFLYFADSGNGIGVLEATSPTGPFRDPLGHPLISRKTPLCDTVTWLFDPAVLVDDDGQGYLYFGGGIPDGMAAAPGTGRCVRLGEDMISVADTPVVLDAPYLFEDSGINKVGKHYVYSYCSNFDVNDPTLPFRSGEICTMVSDKPLGPFRFDGHVLRNPADDFGVGGNNHHCIFHFNDKWYIAYHAQAFEKRLGLAHGYRSPCINEIPVDEATGHVSMTRGTPEGVEAIKSFSVRHRYSAATCAALSGATILHGDTPTLYAQNPNAWVKLARADFGDGASVLSLCYRAFCAGAVSIVLDDLYAAPVAEVQLNASALNFVTADLPLNTTISGVHDLYLVFRTPAMEFQTFQFQE